VNNTWSVIFLAGIQTRLPRFKEPGLNGKKADERGFGGHIEAGESPASAMDYGNFGRKPANVILPGGKFSFIKNKAPDMNYIALRQSKSAK